MDAKIIVRKALDNGLVVPAFNIPHPPMLKPIAQAIKDENSVAMIQVARLEWEKFESESLENIADEYAKYAVPGHTLLHLDHVPVIDEDHLEVDYIPIIKRAIAAGYQSVMVDASRLDLEGNIAATRAVADIAHAAGIPVEAELGAVMGHETSQQAIPYEEIFARKMGFTKVDEALKFVLESHCDWLSVAVGSVHGAIAANLLDQKKPAAKLDIDHITELRNALNIPLVLHGGSGIENDYITRGIKAGIAKINVGTELRQPYERAMKEKNDVEYARECVYKRCRELIRDFLHTADDAKVLVD
ncbi:MAG: class II fructose-bisphosphate aldolase [Clostridiales bacterium]|nr:class II fructose-bisphosphate aldolase [Clostridiales bacterium]